MKTNSGFTYGQLEQLKELAQQHNENYESQHDAKLHVMRGDIIQQLKELSCDKLVLGEYSAIVGQFGFVLEVTVDGKTKWQKRYKENEEIHITEIIDDNYFLSGDLTPSFRAHKSFFKGIVRRGA